jgi:hypothetical protein
VNTDSTQYSYPCSSLSHKFPRSRRALILLAAVSLFACRSRPPAFSIEPGCNAALPAGKPKSIEVGNQATPPPGTYRSARVYANGYVEVKEVLTYNGPGPWLTYSGHACIPEIRAKEFFSRPQSTALEAEVLAEVPPQTPPAVASDCGRPVCQLRISQETPPRSHERYGEIRQDAVLDADGTFWCAKLDDANVLQVERGRIAKPDASRVFEWLVGGGNATAGHPYRVQIRGHGTAWMPASDSAAASRWMQIAAALPTACDPAR